MSHFVGRTDALARLAAAYEVVTGGPAGVASRRAGLVLVTGEAGMGKTALLARFSNEVAARGGTAVWGTCWDGDQVPALWPWTQALRALLDERPAAGTARTPGGGAGAGRSRSLVRWRCSVRRNRVVLPCRTWSWMRRPGGPGCIGAVRSRA